MELPATLHLRPSVRLGGALLGAHGLAAAGWLAAMPTTQPVLAGAGLVPLVFSLWHSLRHHFFRRPAAALVLKADGRIEAILADGACREAEVRGVPAVLPWLIFLLLELGDRKLALVLPQDAVAEGRHRELRLWLRWRVAPVNS